MGFTIYNDLAATTNAAPLSEPQARPDKVDIDVLAAGDNGSTVQTGCAVTPHSSGASLNIDVAAGTVMLAGAVLAVSAQANKTIAAADATNPRRDLITINSSGTVIVTSGTAAATPCLPSIPATSVVIAVVDVPANATSITANNITDKRVLNGDSGWQVVGSGGAPAFTNSWGSFGAPWGVPRFRRLANGLVVMSGLASNASSVTTVAFTLPAGYRMDHQGEFQQPEAGTVTLIKSDGTVQLGAAGTLLGLDGIVFFADQ